MSRRGGNRPSSRGRETVFLYLPDWISLSVVVGLSLMGGLMRRWTIAALCITAILVALPRRGAALSCSSARGSDYHAPQNGAKDVPRNTRIWIGESRIDNEAAVSQFSLIDSRNARVEMTLGHLKSTDGNVWVLTPTRLLEPNETYELRLGSDVRRTFMTSTQVLEDRPAIPRLEVVSTSSFFPPERGHVGRANGWLYTGAKLSVSNASDLLVYDWDGYAHIDTVTFDGQVRGFTSKPEKWFGNGACSHNWPRAAAFSSARTRVASVDVSGAMSEWSAPVLVVLWPSWSWFSAVSWLPALLPLGLVVAVIRMVRRKRASAARET